MSTNSGSDGTNNENQSSNDHIIILHPPSISTHSKRKHIETPPQVKANSKPFVPDDIMEQLRHSYHGSTDKDTVEILSTTATKDGFTRYSLKITRPLPTGKKEYIYTSKRLRTPGFVDEHGQPSVDEAHQTLRQAAAEHKLLVQSPSLSTNEQNIVKQPSPSKEIKPLSDPPQDMFNQVQAYIKGDLTQLNRHYHIEEAYNPRLNDEKPAVSRLSTCHFDKITISGIQLDSKVFPKDKPISFPSRNLIIGIAANIDIRNFAIFCGSLRNLQDPVTVLVFMNDKIPRDHEKIAKESGVILIAYDRMKLLPAYLSTYHPSSLRWILFDWFFNHDSGKYANSFDRILALDIRDSVFQSDPFTQFNFQLNTQTRTVMEVPDNDRNMTERVQLDRNRMLVFGENRIIPITKCDWNRGWIQDCFGDKVLEMVSTQPISCSGVSIGGAPRMIQYIHMMSQVLLGNFPCIPTPNDAIDSKFPKCERNGVDQGVHNALLHLHFLDPVQVKYADTFPVVNLQSSPELMMEGNLGNRARDTIYMSVSYAQNVKIV